MSAYNARSPSLVLSAGNLYPVDATPLKAPPLLAVTSFDDLVAAAYFEAYLL